MLDFKVLRLCVCVSPCGTLVPGDSPSWLQCLSVPQTDTLAGIHTTPTLKVETIRTATTWKKKKQHKTGVLISVSATGESAAVSCSRPGINILAVLQDKFLGFLKIASHFFLNDST